MKCPICKGGVHVVDTRNIRANLVFRLRECKECGERFFTREEIVNEDNNFMDDWHRYDRAMIRKKSMIN